MSVPAHQLVKWIGRCMSGLVRDDGEDVTISERGIVTRFELHHVADGEASTTLSRISVEEGANPEEVAQQLHNAAEYDASTRPGTLQRYLVDSFRGDDVEPDESQPFVIRSKGLRSTGRRDDDTEAPTSTGLLGQMMRHVEQSQRLMVQMGEATVGRLMRDLETEREMRVKLEARFGQLWEAEQAVLDRSSERKLSEAQAIQAAKRRDQMMSMVMALAPALLSGLAGAVMAGKKAPAALQEKSLDMGVRKFLESLDSEEIDGIFKAITPAHQQTLLGMCMAYSQQGKAENAEKPEILQEPCDGETTD